MANRYRVERTVKVTTIDYIEAESEEALISQLENSKSLAGDISALGLADIHQTVSYCSQNEKIVLTKVNC